MNISQCENGHFYDEGKNSECPHCKTQAESGSLTVSGGQIVQIPSPGRDMNEERTMFGPAAPRQQVHVEMGTQKTPQDEKTVGIFRAKKGYDPVTGWLVCIDGAERGRDFRLHAGRNFIGRAIESDIALIDDEQICRRDHCSIVYEPNRSSFMLVRGDGETKIDGADPGASAPITGGEVIEIGASRFTFIPFCKEDRQW